MNKSVYYCLSCSQFHPVLKAKKPNQPKMHSYLRFSQLFENLRAPKAHPENMTISSPDSKWLKSNNESGKKGVNISKTKDKKYKNVQSKIYLDRPFEKPAMTRIKYHKRTFEELSKKTPSKSGKSAMKTFENQSTVIHSQIANKNVISSNQHKKLKAKTEITSIKSKGFSIEKKGQNNSHYNLLKSSNSQMGIMGRGVKGSMTHKGSNSKFEGELLNHKSFIQYKQNQTQITPFIDDEKEKQTVMAPLSIQQQKIRQKNSQHLFDALQNLRSNLKSRKLSQSRQSEPKVQAFKKKLSRIRQAHHPEHQCKYFDNRCFGMNICSNVDQENEIQIALDDLL